MQGSTGSNAFHHKTVPLQSITHPHYQLLEVHVVFCINTQAVPYARSTA
jgi:hypothetical protein